MSVLSTGVAGFLSAGMVAAVFHALLPNHWFPFLAAARFHHWTRRQLLTFTLLVAIAHAAVTVGLGLLMALLGQGVAHFLHDHAPKAAGIVLVVLGALFVIFPHLYGHRHIHHPQCEHLSNAGQAITVAGLFLALALSPCEGLLPLFFAAAVQFGWGQAMVIAVVSSVLTVALLVGIVMTAHKGWERTLQRLSENHERWVASGLLLVLGTVMLFGGWH